MNVVFDPRRYPQHRMHIARTQEAVVIVACQRPCLRQQLLVSDDGARGPAWCRLDEYVFRAPYREIFSVRCLVDPERDGAALHGLDVAVDQGSDVAFEDVAE